VAAIESLLAAHFRPQMRASHSHVAPLLAGFEPVLSGLNKNMATPGGGPEVITIKALAMSNRPAAAAASARFARRCLTRRQARYTLKRADNKPEH